MIEFITRCCHTEKQYEIIIKTDREDHYKTVQRFVRALIERENAERGNASSGEKPWIDARTTSDIAPKPFAISEEMIEKALREMESVRMVPRYIYRTRATGEALMPCLHYFEGSGVVVVDGEGKKWLNGKPYKENIK